MAMANDSTRSSAMSDVFIVLFQISSALLIGYSQKGYLQSDPRSHYLWLRVLAPLDEIFHRTHFKFLFN